MDELTDLKNQLQKIEQEIREAERRIPPHSTKPVVMQMLLSLEDERDELVNRIGKMSRETLSSGTSRQPEQPAIT